MKRTIKQGTYGTNKFWYIHYEPIVPSNKYLMFLGGSGSLSLAGKTPDTAVYDGSLINKMDIDGYGAHFKSGFELDVNYIAVQAVKAYDSIMEYILLWMFQEFKQPFGISGLSLGANAAMNALSKSGADKILFVCYAAGAPDFKNIPKFLDRPCMAVHGDKDTNKTTTYNQDVYFIKKWNEARANKIELVTVPGAGHSGIVWNQAFAIDGRPGSFLPFIIDQFKKNEVLPREDGFYWCKMYNSQWFNIYRYISDTGEWFVCGSSVPIPASDLEEIDPKKIERL